MTVTLNTPTQKKKFDFEIDTKASEIIITSAKKHKFKY